MFLLENLYLSVLRLQTERPTMLAYNCSCKSKLSFLQAYI